MKIELGIVLDAFSISQHLQPRCLSAIAVEWDQPVERRGGVSERRISL